MKWFLLLLLAAILWQKGKGDMVAKCLPGWQQPYAGDECYRIPSTQMYKPFSEARNYCMARGGDLLLIKDQETLDYVTKTRNQMGITQLLYINAQKINSTWTWLEDKTKVNTTLLPLDKTSNGTCAVLTLANHIKDTQCTDYHLFMCHRNIGLPPLCDFTKGYEQLFSHCYKSVTEATTWVNGLKTCKSEGGSLITITADTEQQFAYDVSKADNTMVWIGMTEIGHNDTNGTFSFKWVTGEKTTYYHWEKGQPTHQYKGHGSGVIDNTQYGLWTVQDGTKKELEYICEKNEGSCVYGWESFGHSCYYFNALRTDRYVWEHANATCNEVGASLLVIDGPQENEFIKKHIKENDIFWLGLSSVPGDQFYWIDGEPMNYTSMTPKDKNSSIASKVPKCAYFHTMDKDPPNDIAWTPTDCYTGKHYICEANKGDKISLVNHQTKQYCPQDWLLNNGSCYYFGQEERTWSDASHVCGSKDSHLVSINSWPEQDFVYGNMMSDSFIGYTDNKTDGTWVWSDGSAQGIKPDWATGEPNGGKNENCALLTLGGGKWRDYPCNNKFQYCCEMAASNTPIGPPVTTTTEQPPFSKDCGGTGWTENPNTGECYYVILDEIDYHTARDQCQALDDKHPVTLLSLGTAKEQDFVTDWLKSKKYSQQSFYTCMKNDMSDGNYWEDGSPVQFFNWADSEPGGFEECVEMFTGSGQWNDVSCDETHSFICEKKGPKYKPLQPPKKPSPICPSGWTSFNEHCYLFNKNLVDWSDANYYCKSHLNSTLTSIVDKYENNYILGLVKDANIDIWLGLHDDNKGKNWHWIDGSNLNGFTYWADGEPNDSKGNEHCGEIRHDKAYHWNDELCSRLNGFICKMTIDTCPDGWLYKDKKCYFVGTGALAMNDSRAQCKQFNENADLITIGSWPENSYFTGIMPHGDVGVWIGYTFDNATKKWTWDDGSHAKYANWNDGMPTNTSKAGCTEVVNAPSQTDFGKWNSVKCSEARNYGCEYFPRHYLGCENGWHQFGNYCYHFDTTLRSYSQAKSACQKLGATLTTIHSDTENDFVYSNIAGSSTGMWIGVSDNGHPGTVTNIDGTQFTYSRWKRLLDSELSSPMCTNILTTGQWEPVNCVNSPFYGSTCKKPPEAREVNPNTNTGCNSGDMYYQASCYTFPFQQLDWSDAKDACKANGSQLIRIETKQEGGYLKANLGIFGHDFFTDVMAHHYEDGSADFIFDDGTLAKYLPWDDKEPKLGDGDCIIITGESGHAGLYRTSGCDIKTHFICEYARKGYTTPAPPKTTSHGTNCMDGWGHYNGHCYQIFSDLHTWSEGEQICTSYGGHLVSINNQEEEYYLTQTIVGYQGGKLSGSVWVGLKLNTEADKHWSDGSSINYLHWADGQPLIHNHENCASAETSSMALSCSVCASHLSFICETLEGTIVTTMALPTFTPPPLCDDSQDNWYRFQGHCYKVVSEADEDPQSWDTSLQLCYRDGANLASIENITENFFIESLISQYSDARFWLGGRATDDGGYEWSDGSAFNYAHWAPGEPSHANGEEDCIEMFNQIMGEWNDFNCGHISGRVCKRPYGNTVKPPTTTLPPKGNCPDGWLHSVATGRCFMSGGNDMNDFESVAAICRGKGSGAALASIHSPKEMAFIRVLLADIGGDAWIGLHLADDDYVWVDQTTVDYTPWAPGQPDAADNTDGCVKASNPTGLMDDIECYDWSSYICAMDQDPSITTPNSFPKCDKPDSSYVQYKEDCYKPVKTAKTWQDAEKACQADGGHLASSFGIGENSFLWILAQDPTLSHPWIGLNSIKENSTYSWTDNWPVSYTSWGNHQPNDNATNSNCVRMNSNTGNWFNEKCNEERTYICKYSKNKAPTVPPGTGHCPDDTWHDIPGPYCYRFVPDQMNWADANTRCQTLQGNLSSIHSTYENNAVLKEMKNSQQNVWVGLNKLNGGEFAWSDGTGVDYTNWAMGEPNSLWEQCTEFYLQGGQWNDLDCSSLRPTVCKTTKIPDDIPSNPTQPVITTTTKKPKAPGLSGGAIFGIVISVLFAVALIGFVGFTYMRKKNGNVGLFSSSLNSTRVSMTNIDKNMASDA